MLSVGVVQCRPCRTARLIIGVLELVGHVVSELVLVSSQGFFISVIASWPGVVVPRRID